MDLKQEYKSIVYADDNQIYKKSFIRRGIIWNHSSSWLREFIDQTSLHIKHFTE